MKKISLIIGIVIGITTISGLAYKGYGHFAKTEYVMQLSMRLDNKIIQDRIDKIQERMWSLEDRYIDRDMPKAVMEEYRQLKIEKEHLINKLRFRGVGE